MIVGKPRTCRRGSAVELRVDVQCGYSGGTVFRLRRSHRRPRRTRLRPPFGGDDARTSARARLPSHGLRATSQPCVAPRAVRARRRRPFLRTRASGVRLHPGGGRRRCHSARDAVARSSGGDPIHARRPPRAVRCRPHRRRGHAHSGRSHLGAVREMRKARGASAVDVARRSRRPAQSRQTLPPRSVRPRRAGAHGGVDLSFRQDRRSEVESVYFFELGPERIAPYRKHRRRRWTETVS